ncbi:MULTISPECIES: hypothetical protein [Paenarthrobacter]|uniref:Uncharacterized protein n=1 Tax=Paenarthrobacter ureafaciens TaxID=37931 RepID=A0AAX3EI59_PAEUR|nr:MULTISPECIES: hypothetical protein [Paenarthrobacter]MDO5866000.1 hypothetical protein [Paenarthrobacter sp. SD-2]MDO5877095.1 hypothetical protein [Paenarthrobacter sp. SD-1]UYV92297.1 hypothetical protein NL395_17510 [Paenarthrobacter ureafaciens]UYV96832.1 hypothetical protein NL394_17540 [Paenarthrobacter ureafaciens]WIV32197.1 hypothetical protein QN084_06190 [Paenarthrobacter sp. R1]
MRIRSTKPEFWKSRRIASVSWDARLVLKGLESYVDDNGVGVDDIELIVTDVFPRDMFSNPRETVARVTEAISQLHQAGLVHRYEANGDQLLYISWWETTQRIDKPGKGRNPRPDGTFDYKQSEIRESVASPPVTLAPGTGEQRNRGTEEQRIEKTCPVGPDDFMDWYMAYPRKEARAAAEKAYIKARSKASHEVLVAGAERYAADPNREGQFTKLPATWLNNGCWDDEPLPPRNTGPTTHAQRVEAASQRMLRQLQANDTEPFMIEQ